MCRTESLARIAHRVALTVDESCEFLLGAVVARGNRVLSTGTCSRKTHPKNPKLTVPTKRKQLCAEVDACLRALHTHGDLTGCTVYVVRGARTGGERRMARPCRHCQKFLSDLGIRKVFYSDTDGEMVQMGLC